MEDPEVGARNGFDARIDIHQTLPQRPVQQIQTTGILHSGLHRSGMGFQVLLEMTRSIDASLHIFVLGGLAKQRKERAR